MIGWRQTLSRETRASAPTSVLFMNQNEPQSNEFSRRQSLAFMAASLLLAYPMAVQAKDGRRVKSLEDVALGKGNWNAMGQAENARVNQQTNVVPSNFATYASRLLINFDEGVASWWSGVDKSYCLLSKEDRRNKMGLAFGSFAASVQLSLNTHIAEESKASGMIDGPWSSLFLRFIDRYGSSSLARKQICILFSLLPPNLQPRQKMEQYKGEIYPSLNAEQEAGTSESLAIDMSTLLPGNYGCVQKAHDSGFTISPTINLYEIGINEEFGQAVTATYFGPLSSVALTRDLPTYSTDIYALFGISGATGCALTHSIVIPLDVVKTKAQTDPEEYSNILAGASRILKDEGVLGLLTGAQATLAGYSWYGLSVYPSYTFFKRTIGQDLLPPDFSALHVNDIALVAGALAAVIASLGLTPLEAARIRVVADPAQYKPLGLAGTLRVIAREDSQLGWKALYSGLPSLMTRQVIFGSVKFLAFERASDAIYVTWPFLRDATWTALIVSLVAGGFSGVLSSVVSQPADAVLTYVAQKGDEKGTLGVLEGCQLMIEESGVDSLFRGLGSRSLWAASIIAGQFLLYDVFRTLFGVTVEDLTQVFNVEM